MCSFERFRELDTVGFNHQPNATLTTIAFWLCMDGKDKRLHVVDLGEHDTFTRYWVTSRLGDEDEEYRTAQEQ